LNNTFRLYLLWLIDLRWVLEKYNGRPVFKRAFEQVNLPVVDIRIFGFIGFQLGKIDHVKLKSTHVHRLFVVNSTLGGRHWHEMNRLGYRFLNFILFFSFTDEVTFNLSFSIE